jgi:PPOX class probable F420-dependent enzyme
VRGAPNLTRVSGTSLTELPEWAAKLVEHARVAHLGLLDEHDRPRVQPITFVRVNHALYTAVDHKPKRKTGRDLARVKRLTANPNATITVDHYDDDWTRLAWVQAVGTITIADDIPDDVTTALQAKYAQYESQPPRGPLLALRPELVIWWRASG